MLPGPTADPIDIDGLASNLHGGPGVDSEGSLTRFGQDLYSTDLERREEAARQVWLRFSDRLSAVVRRRLNAQILRRAGLDDVMQSLFASFFAAGPGPLGPPSDRTELWRRLVRFTIYKVANTADYHRAQCRDIRRERLDGDLAGGGPGNDTRPIEFLAADAASPEEQLIAHEELTRLLAVLPEDLRHVLTLRIIGHTNAEVAREIGRVERTVELKLRAIRGLLQPLLTDVASLDDDGLAPE